MLCHAMSWSFLLDMGQQRGPGKSRRNAYKCKGRHSARADSPLAVCYVRLPGAGCTCTAMAGISSSRFLLVGLLIVLDPLVLLSWGIVSNHCLLGPVWFMFGRTGAERISFSIISGAIEQPVQCVFIHKLFWCPMACLCIFSCYNMCFLKGDGQIEKKTWEDTTWQHNCIFCFIHYPLPQNGWGFFFLFEWNGLVSFKDESIWDSVCRELSRLAVLLGL